MSASLELTGLKQMVEALERYPEDFTREELGPAVQQAAEELAADLKSAYPKVTGTLADRVVIDRGTSPLRVKVRSKAPHAHLYEYGTVSRFTNSTGANRGSMPAQPVFVPTAIRGRERMVRAVAGIMRRMKIPGFTGTPEVRQS